jgi:hypothetical protein
MDVAVYGHASNGEKLGGKRLSVILNMTNKLANRCGEVSANRSGYIP